MPQSEFDIIEEYFNRQQGNRDDVILGIGDDAAIVSVPSDKQLVIAIDTLVAGVHFPLNTSAEDIGYKALAVNLSDLAAMGAEPAWFTLALTLPESNKDWLAGFAKGLFSLADEYKLQLVGGDTTQGPLTISIQVAGYVPAGKALKRSGARVGDLIYVTGTLGDAALGLRCMQHADKYPVDHAAIKRLNRPQPQCAFAQSIRELVSACIDISDGLLSDLGHILDASQTGATIDRQAIPLSDNLRALCEQDESNYSLALNGGDDYELCFCIPADRTSELEIITDKTDIRVTQIGVIEPQSGVRLVDAEQPCNIEIKQGYEHFSG